MEHTFIVTTLIVPHDVKGTVINATWGDPDWQSSSFVGRTSAGGVLDDGSENVVIVMEVTMPRRSYAETMGFTLLFSVGNVRDFGTVVAIDDNENFVFASGKPDGSETDDHTVYIKLPLSDSRIAGSLDGEVHEIALLLYSEGATIALFIDGDFHRCRHRYELQLQY